VRISWDDAINRIARLMKDDRDANFMKNAQGQTVNRWTTTGMPAPRRPVMSGILDGYYPQLGWSPSIARRVWPRADRLRDGNTFGRGG
jgi:anaerobic selenocysteine-containing dehydrogenase